MAASSLAGPSIIAAQALTESNATAQTVVGSYMETADGRGFRYSKIGATSTVVGKIYQSSAQDTTNYNPSGGLAVAAQNIGDTSITLTGTLTITANALQGGFAGINITPGQGYMYRIAKNTGVAAAANAVITLDDPIVVALTTASKVVLAPHPYNGVIVNPTTATGAPVGVAQAIVTNAQYGWLQTFGPALLLNDAGTAVGLGLAPSAATAGAAKTNAATLSMIGYALTTQVTTEYDLVFLTIH